MEDHHLVFVVAENEIEARKLAKKKWSADDIHVDGTQKIIKVDGYKIILQKTEEQDEDLPINPEYSE